jgi:glycosyltransferase involved in cell wall biosynthesis
MNAELQEHSNAVTATEWRSEIATPRRLHVVIVDEELPFPATSGKRIRSFNLALRLAARHRLTYVCHRNADPQEVRPAQEFFRDHGIEPVMVDYAVPPKSGAAFYARLAGNLFSSLPYSVVTHNSAALRAALARVKREQPVDLWHCEWTPYAAAVRAIAPEHWVVMAHNIESLIWQRYGETESHPAKRWYIKQQWKKFVRFERSAYAAADCTIAVSEPDAKLAREQFNARRVAVVDNGVDVDYFRPTGARRDGDQILCLGSLDWRPNQDAVRVMLGEIFPAVRRQRPTAKLWIVGRNPPDWMAPLVAAVEGASLVGNVPDVRPYLEQSSVLAVPLRIGGGSRLKIIEALASGLPVVSTEIGAEGLDFVPGRHLETVAQTDQMAQTILATLANPSHAQAQAQAARELVLAHYDWSALALRLETIWLDCAPCCTA